MDGLTGARTDFVQGLEWIDWWMDAFCTARERG